MKISNIVCDMCNATLNGMEKARQIKKNHIRMKGSITQQMFDPDTGYQTYAYISASPETEHFFCDPYCFADYVQLKLERDRNRRQAYLREEAAGSDISRTSERY